MYSFFSSTCSHRGGEQVAGQAGNARAHVRGRLAWLAIFEVLQHALQVALGGQADPRELNPLDQRQDHGGQPQTQQRDHDQTALGEFFVECVLKRGQLEGVAERRIEHQFAGAGRHQRAAGSFQCVQRHDRRIGLFNSCCSNPAASPEELANIATGPKTATLPVRTRPCLSSAFPSKTRRPGTPRSARARCRAEHCVAKTFPPGTDPPRPPPCPPRRTSPGNAVLRRSSAADRNARAVLAEQRIHIFHLIRADLGLGLERVEFDELVFLKTLRLERARPCGR